MDERPNQEPVRFGFTGEATAQPAQTGGDNAAPPSSVPQYAVAAQFVDAGAVKCKCGAAIMILDGHWHCSANPYAEDLEGQAPAQPLTPEQAAREICRELYDRFVMGGWEPQNAHAEAAAIIRRTDPLEAEIKLLREQLDEAKEYIHGLEAGKVLLGAARRRD